MPWIIDSWHPKQGVDLHGKPPGCCGDAQSALTFVAESLALPVTDLKLDPFPPKGADTHRIVPDPGRQGAVDRFERAIKGLPRK